MSMRERTGDVLFDLTTTNLAHYRKLPFDVYSATTAELKPPKPRKPVEMLKDIHTMSEWKTQLPFMLYYTPKEIIRTNPHARLTPYVSEKYEMKSYEEQRIQAQMTRPRLVLPPACILDDFEDEKRKILIDETYLTSTEKALRSAVPNYNYVVAPITGTFADPRPIRPMPLKGPYVSKEWRMETLDWDRHQLRYSCNPTKLFWQEKTKTNQNYAPACSLQCQACNETGCRFQRRKLGGTSR